MANKSVTAHRIRHTFHATFDGLEWFGSPIWPTLQRDNPTADIETEAGDPIQLDGQTADTQLLRARKISRNTFIATGGHPGSS